jgi:hypothetical protein
VKGAQKTRRLGGGIRRASFCALLVAMAAAAAPSARADGEAAEMANDDPAPGDAPAGPDTQVGVQGDSYADTDPGALTDFRPALDPHGAWVDDPTYGTVWVPNSDEVGTDFRPYVSAGHWAYDDDYVWVSDYEWGWAAFHYGRWVWTTGRGWAWIAGREYAGAWVGWRIGDGDYAYIGWAPLAPVWGWRDGVAGALGFASREPYVFCPSREVFSPSVATRLAGTDQASSIATHTHSYAGPAAARVAARPVVQTKPRGPAPALLGLEPSQVARVTRSDPGLLRARQFAKPSTALALGAHPPVTHYVRAGMAARPVAVTQPGTRPSVKKK